MGACLCDLSLGQHTGDGIEGRRCWVERGCFFQGGAGEGGRGRGRGTPGHDCRDVFGGRREFQTALFMLYIIYFVVGVSLPRMSSGHREGGPRSSISLGRHMRCSASTTRRPSPRIEDGEGVVVPRSGKDSTEQWV
jgi:hypothetical protein